MNRKSLFYAGAIGNSIEVFEKVVYGFLQPFITKTFFPENLRENYLLFFFTLIIPVLARPIGALFFGVLGDLKGRKAVLESTMILSGISCALMAILPSYQQAGLASFFGLFALRFLFGFSMAGEYNNSFLYLGENAEPRSRGFIISWASFGVSFGIFWAALLAYLFTHAIENHFFPAWSFRGLFLFSFVCLYLSYRARKELSESLEFFLSFPAFEEKKKTCIIRTAKNELFGNLLNSIKIIFVLGFAIHITYALTYYAPFHLVQHNTVPLSFSEAISLIIFSTGINCILKPFFGKLSDRIGRKFLLLTSAFALTVLYLFFFFSLANNSNYNELLLFYGILSFFMSMYSVSEFEVVESLPHRMRSTVNGVLRVIPSVILGAFSLPYFQAYFDKTELTPLVILLIVIPLIFILLRSKEKLFKPTVKYMYELEKAKVT